MGAGNPRRRVVSAAATTSRAVPQSLGFAAGPCLLLAAPCVWTGYGSIELQMAQSPVSKASKKTTSSGDVTYQTSLQLVAQP